MTKYKYNIDKSPSPAIERKIKILMAAELIHWKASNDVLLAWFEEAFQYLKENQFYDRLVELQTVKEALEMQLNTTASPERDIKIMITDKEKIIGLENRLRINKVIIERNMFRIGYLRKALFTAVTNKGSADVNTIIYYERKLVAYGTQLRNRRNDVEFCTNEIKKLSNGNTFDKL